MSEDSRLEHGVKEVADRLNERLRRFIESQYHVRDEGLIQERHALLTETGTIAQEAYVETTPSYELGLPYGELGLPSPVGETLSELASLEPAIGVFPRPYVHQAQALRAYFNEGRDLIVATGTGSGKTETFLFPILGELLLEAKTRPVSFHEPGCRALLLYPMNALVSDQMSRLRRLFGDERLSRLFKERYGRFPRFGMYTSRTPYPGPRLDRRDQYNLLPLLNYYLELEEPAPGLDEARRESLGRLKQELQARGRWPAKNLRGFYGRKGGRLSERFTTQPEDRELLTRHEMQASCPDILVTNFSMLEYMLLRPIERPIFDQTRQWLARDSRNSLVLVLDEAHMYHGSGGAEVALLIRRLQARLGVDRDRLRCILTSASLSARPESEQSIQAFAAAMTGQSREGQAEPQVIRGKRESRPASTAGTSEDALALATFDLGQFHQRAENPSAATQAVARLAAAMRWPLPPATAEQRCLREYLYERLSGFGPLEQLIASTAGNATSVAAIARTLFPNRDVEIAHRALDTLLALGTYAHRGDRPLLSTRVHLLFRGLPSLYACVNPHCNQRRHRPGEELLVGRLYTEPRTHCSCSLRGRVYELYTHRDCGAAFLRVFGRGPEADFYWHEQGGSIVSEGQPLDETWLLVGEPHASQRERVEPVWLELSTGRIETEPPAESSRYRLLYRPATHGDQASRRSGKTSQRVHPGGPAAGARAAAPFEVCPACTKRNAGHWIMGMATRGDQPFANLVREQLVTEPLETEPGEQHPNGGRKVLLFSDGRQKAARLARDLPREVEAASFREVLLLAAQRLIECRGEARLDNQLYAAFVSVCRDYHLHLFDRESTSQSKLLEDIRAFDELYGDFVAALEDWTYSPPLAYRTALLRQVSDPIGSLYHACVAVVRPSRPSLRKLIRSLPGLPATFRDERVSEAAGAWVQDLLERTAFDPSIDAYSRREIDEYFRPLEPDDRPSTLVKILTTYGGLGKPEVETLHERLLQCLTEADRSGNAYLVPGALALEPALDKPWLQCAGCGIVQHQGLIGRCVYCGEDKLELRSPDHPYMRSRKDHDREPVRAVLRGAAPLHFTTEEHTAQLSHRDARVAYATTEEYELRFQDVPLYDPDTGRPRPPVDILSCTTTMEVGIDIGALNAIGLRNVPPQRENYQQRAGRAGRRGSAVSTVVTYAQDGPHDGYYYSRPEEIISGQPREPRVRVDNPRLARRHIHSFLIQTFFHATLGRLGSTVRQSSTADRTHLMSALGSAAAFFGNRGDFTLESFRSWVQERLSGRQGPLSQEIAAWLPDELCQSLGAIGPSRLDIKCDFATQVARDFLRTLEQLAARYAAGGEPSPDNLDENAEASQDGEALLLNVLFENGLLPSYAFPTDLCTFYVFGRRNGRVVVQERPEQSKDKALSEYAPGRLLVVNKETYRVGGIYVEGVPSLTPGRALFEEKLGGYVHCRRCAYVRLEPLRSAAERCPVCDGSLESRETLDPPGFSPEGGEPLRERDRDQDFSYATAAQFPLPLRPDEFVWRTGVGDHLRYAYEENRRLVIVNKGPEEKGFRVCESCGAAWPEAGVTRKAHRRPFLVDWASLRRDGAKDQCEGPLHESPLYLGHTFLTDLLILRLSFCAPMEYHPHSPWLHDGLRTLAEALSLGASLELDIDPSELNAGYRLVPSDSGDGHTVGAADIYLYDAASGGAGYAAEAGTVLADVLDRAQALLDQCPGQCERSCTKCLRHYGNRYWHERLDRNLGAQLLAYARSGRVPEVAEAASQAHVLAPLRRYLELEGAESETRVTVDGVEVPLLVTLDSAGGTGTATKLAVGIYPALLNAADSEFVHPLGRLRSRRDLRTVLLNDYVVTRDLPTAYQRCVGSRAPA